MKAEEFAQLLELNSELRSVEFKGPGGITDKPLLLKVIRASLGLSNIRGGGYIIIGIDEDKVNQQLNLIGLTDEQVKSWSFDSLGDKIAVYADPYVSFLPPEITSYQGNTFVVIRINEFEEVPVLCKKDADGLQQGYCYVRTRRKPETISIPSQTEMRELLELAVVKGVKKYLSQTASLGINLNQLSQQLNPDFHNSAIERLHNVGFWKVTIILEDTQITQLQGGDMYELVADARVNAHTRTFPKLSHPYFSGILSNLNCEGNDFLEGEPESWRMFENGIFVYYFGIFPDWIDPTFLKEWNIAPGKIMVLEDIVANFTRIIQLALNLQNSKKVQSSSVQIKVELEGLGERILSSDNPSSWMSKWKGYVARTTRYHYTDRYTQVNLLANAQNISIAWASRFLKSIFQVSLNENLLKDIQALNY